VRRKWKETQRGGGGGARGRRRRNTGAPLRRHPPTPQCRPQVNKVPAIHRPPPTCPEGAAGQLACLEPTPSPPLPPPGSGPSARRAATQPLFFFHELATGRLDQRDPATSGPDGHAPDWLEWDNGWALMQRPRCLHPLPTSEGGGAVWSHLSTCRFWPTTEEVRRTRAALGPTPCPRCHPVRGHPIHCQQSPRPTPGGGISPHAGTWSPTRA